MSAVEAQKALRAAKEGRFSPVYYVTGEDVFLTEEWVRLLVEAAVDPATRDFNLEVRRGNDVDAETLGSLLGTPPMMAERRCVVVRDVGSLKKDARAALDRYLRTPANDAVVILVAGPDAKADKGLESAATTIRLKALEGDRLEKWIARTAQDAGASMLPEASALLQEAVGTDLGPLRLEIDKLVAYVRGRPDGSPVIDEAAVTAVVGVHREETMGQLLDAIGQRDAVTALARLPGVLQQPKNGAVPVIMQLTVQTMGIGWAVAMRENGTPPGRLEGELFGFLKSVGSVYVGRSWGEAVKAWARAVPQWTSRDVSHALETLLQADLALKTTKLSSDEQILSNVILSLCGTPRRRRAA
jgi:DNA polymerase III subunit delta